ncbi:GTPase [Mahella australiensis 50-1 BON]|uniref:GTPase n=1 Tax=Mahella australiensis (strain DSM 15567 / CIP 107919 / 50-1 BON) TaxID=697281 RepID=F3ZZE2_MAHA5|nr:GTPase [Mahella australiensis 50-1 BON]
MLIVRFNTNVSRGLYTGIWSDIWCWACLPWPRKAFNDDTLGNDIISKIKKEEE